MEDNYKIRVGITHGDINGVGYEVILKTFSDPTMLELCTPIIYGSPKVAAYHRKAMDIQTNFSIVNSADDAQPDKLSIVNCTEDELKVELSKPTPEAGKAALDALERALQDYREGMIDVLVTAPINKHTIQSESFHFPGHTEYIEERVGEGQKALMILLKNDFRVALVTYSLAVIAMKLKEVFQLNDINELPIVYNIAWYEQKAVIVLLALLSLGVKDIHLGPTLPAFLSPNVVKVLVDMFHIAGIGSVEDDLKKFGL